MMKGAVGSVLTSRFGSSAHGQKAKASSLAQQMLVFVCEMCSHERVSVKRLGQLVVFVDINVKLHCIA